MGSIPDIMDDDGRKRHLDELFADQPFLSPTMKARAMHDRLRALHSGEIERTDRCTGVAQVADWLLPAPARTPARSERSADPAEGVPFIDAVNQIRRQAASGVTEFRMSPSLVRFRAEVLAQWAQEVRPRETPRDSGGAPSESDSCLEMGWMKFGGKGGPER